MKTVCEHIVRLYTMSNRSRSKSRRRRRRRLLCWVMVVHLKHKLIQTQTDTHTHIPYTVESSRGRPSSDQRRRFAHTAGNSVYNSHFSGIHCHSISPHFTSLLLVCADQMETIYTHWWCSLSDMEDIYKYIICICTSYAYVLSVLGWCFWIYVSLPHQGWSQDFIWGGFFGYFESLSLMFWKTSQQYFINNKLV